MSEDVGLEVQLNKLIKGFCSEGSETMGRQFGTGREDKTEFYARQWFASMAKFHRVDTPATWEFTEEDLIAFLRHKLKNKMPTWKRLKAVEGMIWYRNNVRQSSTPRLEMVRAKLLEMAAKENEPKNEVAIDDVVGKINPREPDVIQELRRKIRLKGHAYNTEKAYVKKVRAFMADQRVPSTSGQGYRFRSRIN